MKKTKTKKEDFEKESLEKESLEKEVDELKDKIELLTIQKENAEELKTITEIELLKDFKKSTLMFLEFLTKDRKSALTINGNMSVNGGSLELISDILVNGK